MGLDLGKMGLSKLGKGMGLWNFVWSIEEREREVPKNLRDMGGEEWEWQSSVSQPIQSSRILVLRIKI